MSGITIRKLEKHYGAVQVLKGIDLEVAPGEFTVLLGPSGCGKSTLLGVIAGLEDFNEGALLIGDRDVGRVAPDKRGIAMVFQSYALYPAMSVRRNLSFGLKVAGVPKAEIEQRVTDVARLLQIEALLDRKPAALSGGQRQRVAIGRALVRDAKVFLFDEPLSNLDAKLRAEMRVEIKKLHRDLTPTVVYVTHDQIEAMTLADRIAVMSGGKVEQYAAPQELYDRPETLFVAGFVGSPAMNLLSGRLSDANGGTFVIDGRDFGVGGYPFRAGRPEAKDAVLGIRPEDLRIDPSGPLPVSHLFNEPMGADTLAWFLAGEQRISVRLKSADAQALPSSAALAFDAGKLSLFDNATGARL
jgi:multiple sugar transport system ATP-binding protein